MNILLVIAAAVAALQPSDAGFHRTKVVGKTLPGAYVVANTGEIVRANDKGEYELELPVEGVYCLKSMQDGYREAVRPWLTVPAPGPVNFNL